MQGKMYTNRIMGPAVKTYPDCSLRARNNGVIGQLDSGGARKYSHSVLRELQSDHHGLVHSCKNRNAPCMFHKRYYKTYK